MYHCCPNVPDLRAHNSFLHWGIAGSFSLFPRQWPDCSKHCIHPSWRRRYHKFRSWRHAPMSYWNGAPRLHPVSASSLRPAFLCCPQSGGFATGRMYPSYLVHGSRSRQTQSPPGAAFPVHRTSKPVAGCVPAGIHRVEGYWQTWLPCVHRDTNRHGSPDHTDRK